MKRRDFLVRLLAGASGAALAATLDLDKLLWVPGAKTIFIPPIVPVGVRMGNMFLTPEWIVRAAAEMYVKSLDFAKHVNRTYDADYMRHTIASDMRTRLAS